MEELEEITEVKMGEEVENIVSEEKPVKVKHKRKKITERLSFKVEVFLLILFIVFFAVLAEIMSFSVGSNDIETYNDFSEKSVEKSSISISYFLDSYFKDLRVYTKSTGFMNGDVQEARQYMLDNIGLMGSDFDYVGIATMDGTLYTSNGDSFSISDKEYFKDIVQRGKPNCISNPYISQVSGDYTFAVAVPVMDRNGIPFGMFMAEVPVLFLEPEIEKAKIVEDGYSFALDGEGNIISHPEKSVLGKNLSECALTDLGLTGIETLYDDMISGRDGASSYKDTAKGGTMNAYYHTIDGTNWMIAITIPEAEVSSGALQSRLMIYAICLIIIVVIMIFIWLLLKFLLKPLRVVKNSITDIARGDADLTKKIDVTTKDEVGDVVIGFNFFVENLRGLITRIKNSKDRLASIDTALQRTAVETGESMSQIVSNIEGVTNQIGNSTASVDETTNEVSKIADSIESLTKLIENQAMGISQASAAVEQMIGNIMSVSRSTEHMAETFEHLEKETQSGVEKQNDVNNQIIQIEEQSQTLMTANNAISAIASETNLLAMNAAIEAAHAGEAGKGFSVVADEIRKLSETSAAQSKTIGAEIKKIQQAITNVVASSNEAKEAFNLVSQKIIETDQLMRQIRGAMEESEQGSHQITDALKIMNDSTVEVRTSSSHMSERNALILEKVNQLHIATAEMKESVQGMSSSISAINQTGTTLTDITAQMQESIGQIGREIDLFIV